MGAKLPWGLISKISSRVRDFKHCENGTATAEAVLWLPLFLGAFMLIVDVSMIFNGQTSALRVVQDANRNYSIGRLTTPAELSTYIQNALTNISPNATVTTSESAGSVITSVLMPSSDLVLTGWFDMLGTTNVSVQAEHVIEF